ncbi:MAG: hypothetical protein L3J09_00435 [Flavobacteriaceae bacterium]|nr:hypothetical protein [Flavobacteriaceae bacterium]
MNLEITEDFKDIQPYTKEQVLEALKWLETNNEFIKGIQFFYPKWTKNEVIKKLRNCKSCSDFQVQFIEMVIKNSIKATMSSFKIVGIEEINKPNCLYISNHRDIFLDSALLQNHLWDIGRPFTEISLGDNLMVNETMKAVSKLNNMFTVIRNSNRSETIRNSINLSNYLRYSITKKNTSSWIAQNRGRTKNGNDITAPGLVKMLLLSGGKDIKEAVRELNIVVSSISYEYEPCAFEKANELSIIAKEGVYKKRQFENIYSLVNGVKDPKGNVKLVFEELNVNNINFTNNRKKDVISIANEIDRVVYKNYQIQKTNYIAHDMLYNETKYRHHYTDKEVGEFKEYLSKATNEDIYHRVLKMYVVPLHNKEKSLA